MRRKLTITMVAGLFFMVSGMLSAASALTITYEDSIWSLYGDTFAPSGPSAVESELGLESGSLTSYYKSDFGETESGLFSDSYTTLWADLDASDEPWSAYIEYNDGYPSLSGYDPLYLVVVDGQHRNYIFDLVYLGWDGTETIFLDNMPSNAERGAISHLEIMGGEGVPVPEPTVLLLMGIGLLGIIGFGRRKLAR